MDDLFKGICTLLETVNVNISFKPPESSALINSAAPEEGLTADEEDFIEGKGKYESKKDSKSSSKTELLSITLKSFMETLSKNHPPLAKQLKHAALTDSGILVVFCTEDAHLYCHNKSNELHQEARYALGANYLFFVAVNGEHLSQETIDDTIDYLECYVEDTKEDLDEVSFEGLPETEEIIYEDKSPSYTFQDLYEIVTYRSLDKIPLSPELSKRLLEYLWDKELTGLMRKRHRI
jgi:hypothetical protein